MVFGTLLGVFTVLVITYRLLVYGGHVGIVTYVGAIGPALGK